MEYNVRTGKFEQYKGQQGEFDRFTTATEKIQTLEKSLSRMTIQVRSQRMVLILILIVLTVTVLAGCSSESPKGTPVDLTGTWHQTKNDIPNTELIGTVKDGKIIVDLKIGEVTGPYWNGSYISGPAQDPTSFESHIDRKAISYEKMAETKKFLYSNGAISFEFGAMGKTTIVYLEKD